MTYEHYILQAYRESCIKYPNINQNPRDHFDHLFFTNGNGIEFYDGNPHVWVEFNRLIPWKDYYRDQKLMDELKEYFWDYMVESELEENFKIIEEFQSQLPNYSPDKLWDKLDKDIRKEIDGLYDLSLEEAKSKDFWATTFNDLIYWPDLRISKGFYKLETFNFNTDRDLLKIAIPLMEATLDFYKTHDDPTEFKTSIGRSWNDENLKWILQYRENDMDIISKEIKRCQYLLS